MLRGACSARHDQPLHRKRDEAEDAAAGRVCSGCILRAFRDGREERCIKLFRSMMRLIGQRSRDMCDIRAWVEAGINFSGAGLFWVGQAPKLKNSGSGVPLRKFWVGYRARSTTAILSGFSSFQAGGKFPLARRTQFFNAPFHPGGT